MIKIVCKSSNENHLIKNQFIQSQDSNKFNDLVLSANQNTCVDLSTF